MQSSLPFLSFSSIYDRSLENLPFEGYLALNKRSNTLLILGNALLKKSKPFVTFFQNVSSSIPIEKNARKCVVGRGDRVFALSFFLDNLELASA